MKHMGRLQGGGGGAVFSLSAQRSVMTIIPLPHYDNFANFSGKTKKKKKKIVFLSPAGAAWRHFFMKFILYIFLEYFSSLLYWISMSARWNSKWANLSQIQSTNSQLLVILYRSKGCIHFFFFYSRGAFSRLLLICACTSVIILKYHISIINDAAPPDLLRGGGGGGGEYPNTESRADSWLYLYGY